MTKEEKLQKRLNEICFPELAKQYEVFNVGDMLLWSNKTVRQLKVGYMPLNKITLELVLKALFTIDDEVEYNVSMESIICWSKHIVDLLDTQEVYDLWGYVKINWRLLKPFIDQSEETKDALYKIF